MLATASTDDTSTAVHSAADRRWSARPWAARAVRVTIFVVPFVTAMAVAFVLSSALPLADSLVVAIMRWLGIVVVATVALVIADRVARRLLPLSALLNLTLVFPDQAPSRFHLAMRTGTTAQLKRRLDRARAVPVDETPQEAAERLLELVGLLGHHDRLTRGHSERVRAYTQMLGEEMGIRGSELDKLRWAGLVHDIGKTAIAQEILNKPGRLDDSEYAIVKSHPLAGQALVGSLADWLGDSVRAVWEHHERFDGTGYPAGLSGTDISIAARIVSVADSYDVMTSARSYKKPMSAAAARAELAQNAGTQFDPVVVRAFLNISLGRLRIMNGPLAFLAQWIAFEPAGIAHAGGSLATTSPTTTVGALGAMGSSSGVVSSVAAATMSVAASTAGIAVADPTPFPTRPVEVVTVEMNTDDDAGNAPWSANNSSTTTVTLPNDDNAAVGGAATADQTVPAPAAESEAGAGASPDDVALDSTPVTSVNVERPATPATPATPADGDGAAIPATPATPADGDGPATPATPATPVIPADGDGPAIPATPATPADGDGAVTPATPATPVTPADGGGPATPVTPADGNGPTTPATPAGGNGPDEQVNDNRPTVTASPAARDLNRLYLGVDGTVDQAALDMVEMSLDAPPDAPLANLDTDVDADPGRLLVAGGDLDAASNVLTFRYEAEEQIDVIGVARVELGVAPAGFGQAATQVDVGVYVCSTVGCERVGEDSKVVRNQSTFRMVTFVMPNVSDSLDAGDWLEVRVAASASNGDAWIAYGTAEYPAQFELSG